VKPVLGGYDPAKYATEFAWAIARDGTKVPVSIVYAQSTPRNGTAPLLQIGYGSYGASYDPEFSVPDTFVLDRGFVVAIAHIRGGQEMGRAWYENGKLLNKQNTLHRFHRRHALAGGQQVRRQSAGVRARPFRRRVAHGAPSPTWRRRTIAASSPACLRGRGHHHAGRIHSR
jgi:protease II